MKARKFFAFVAGAAMLFGAVGCNPDQGGNEVSDDSPAAITVNPATIATTLEGESCELTVTSNAEWTVTCDQSDVTITPAEGVKDGVVTVTIPAAAARNFEIVFKAKKQAAVQGIAYTSTAEAVVTVSQNATGEVIEGGIASIKEAGEYEIEGAWVLATYAQGFLMTDLSAGIILVYQGNGATVPAVGQVVNVSGAVSLYGGLLQFGKDATVEQVAGKTQTVTYPEPTVLDYAAIQSYVNNPTIFYAEFRGQMIVKDSGKGYNNYNIQLDGGDAVKGSISYPADDLATAMDAMADAYVVARGYMIGKPNSNSYYANMMALSVELDESVALISASNISNVPAEGVTNATHNITVVGVDAVTATPDGAVVTAASVSGNVLTYSVAANAGDARQGSIVLSAAGVESVTVTVSQKGAVVVPTDAMEFTRELVVSEVPGITVNGYGTQNVTSLSTYLTIGNFLACKVCLPSAGDYDTAGCLQMQGNTDAAKQGRVGNTVATPGKIKKIIVESYNAKYTPNFNLALGTEQVVGTTVPTGMIAAEDMETESVVEGSLTKYTSTYEVTGDYNYFAIYKNTTGAFYFTKIRVEYAAE